MRSAKQFGNSLHDVQYRFNAAKNRISSAGKSAVAGAAGAALVLGNIGSAIREKPGGHTAQHTIKQKDPGEVIIVKKSTVVALLVALAAVAGILAALYFYVLRRERELDEYEQLLFSEDFDDDLMDDDLEAPAEPTDA